MLLSYLCSHIQNYDLRCAAYVKRKVMHQHGSLLFAGYHLCRLLTLFVVFLPISPALSECMEGDRPSIIIWPLRCYDVLCVAETICGQTLQGTKVTAACRCSGRISMCIFNCTHTAVKHAYMHSGMQVHKKKKEKH